MTQANSWLPPQDHPGESHEGFQPLWNPRSFNLMSHMLKSPSVSPYTASSTWSERVRLMRRSLDTGPEFFYIFINHLDAELEGILSKFADDTKLGGAVDSLEGREALQRDFDRLEDWAISNHMKFNRGKCRILQLGCGSPGCLYRLRNEMLESSDVKRELGVLANGKLNMSQQ
ncbi:rna-directed dna polymerase from mobile element jockey-like [Pitangus sulphuratus]|nr:rna-directed dna polymerase from mobile element jockey-like [Pitangus sulphuratus]